MTQRGVTVVLFGDADRGVRVTDSWPDLLIRCLLVFIETASGTKFVSLLISVVGGVVAKHKSVLGRIFLSVSRWRVDPPRMSHGRSKPKRLG